jgi:hypothetical protein
MTDFLGPWVRLEGMSIAQLPVGGKGTKPSNLAASSEKYSDGSASTSAAPNLKTFIANAFAEAIPFIDGVAPKSGIASTWKSKGSPKKYAASEAPVHLYEWVVSGKDLDRVEGMSQFSADRKDETWFCRRSCHRNKAETGTASWEEFTRSFKVHHAESEKAFTPTVIGARQAMSWNASGMEIEVDGGKWIDIIVNVEEMTHRIEPKPLKNRTFPVIQVSASLADADEFVVVTIPLNDFEKSPYAEDAKDKSLVLAAYVSVERIRVLPSNGDVEWIMATASDAKGILPQWMQNMAVPSAIAKDVELFMSWIPSQRSHTIPTPISKSDPAEKTLPEAPVSKSGNPSETLRFEDKPAMIRRESTNKELPPAPAMG